MDGGAWWATVHRVAKSWTQLSNLTSLCLFGKERKLIVSQARFRSVPFFQIQMKKFTAFCRGQVFLGKDFVTPWIQMS